MQPSHLEDFCWGCNHNCPAYNRRCGSEVERTPHPAELFDEDEEWLQETQASEDSSLQA